MQEQAPFKCNLSFRVRLILDSYRALTWAPLINLLSLHSVSIVLKLCLTVNLKKLNKIFQYTALRKTVSCKSFAKMHIFNLFIVLETPIIRTSDPQLSLKEEQLRKLTGKMVILRDYLSKKLVDRKVRLSIVLIANTVTLQLCLKTMYYLLCLLKVEEIKLNKVL